MLENVAIASSSILLLLAQVRVTCCQAGSLLGRAVSQEAIERTDHNLALLSPSRNYSLRCEALAMLSSFEIGSRLCSDTW